MVYIDPRTPRRMTASSRAAKLRAMAAQRAAEARRERIRLVVHGIIMLLGIWSFRHTDVHSDDPFESGTLLLMDMLFCVYLLCMLFIEVWRRTTR